MDKAIEKLIAKRNILLVEYAAFQDDKGMIKIADTLKWRETAQQIHCLNYAIGVLGER